jgi:hypothetical protein
MNTNNGVKTYLMKTISLAVFRKQTVAYIYVLGVI